MGLTVLPFQQNYIKILEKTLIKSYFFKTIIKMILNRLNTSAFSSKIVYNIRKSQHRSTDMIVP